MKKIMTIFSGVLMGIILFQFLFYKCESGRSDKQIEVLEQQLSECINAPVKTDTLIRYDTLKQVIKLPYTYRVIDTVKVDSLVNWNLERREYTGSYNHPQFELHWKADVVGELWSLTIEPPSLIKSLTITKEKTVNISQDCDKVKPERSHLYTTFGGTVIGKDFGGIDAGLMYIRKEGWGLSGGIGTDFNSMMYRAGLIIRLK